MKYVKNIQWLEAEVKDELLMMHADSGRFVSLNDTGTFLWNRMGEPRDVATLARELAAEFDVSEEQARSDVGEWIATMCENDVLVEDAG